MFTTFIALLLLATFSASAGAQEAERPPRPRAIAPT
jgi:hypothetical protein